MKIKAAIVISLAVISSVVNARISYDLSVNGANAKVVFKVVDQDGVAVSGAEFRGAFSANRLDDSVLIDGISNTNGEFIAQGKCNEFLRVGVTKEGYYHTEEKVNFWQSKLNPLVVDGKWQPYGETRTVILKKIKNPIRLCDPDARVRHKYPESGKWVGFDLELCDWVQPLGNGKCADMMVRYTRSPLLDGYSKSLDVAFTNNLYAGVYLLGKDSYSELDSVYEANTNGEYISTLRYEFERTANGNHMISELGKNEYLVFRTRTKIDCEGRLISAHYGRIMGCWDYVETGNMILSSYFNPTPNDTNLEDAETARLSRLGYKQRLEFERRRKAKKK